MDATVTGRRRAQQPQRQQQHLTKGEALYEKHLGRERGNAGKSTTSRMKGAGRIRNRARVRAEEGVKTRAVRNQMMAACYRGDFSEVRVMVEAGVPVDFADEIGRTRT
jgi:hypothetical protein